MPNYSIIINSRFRPFSYQELLAPVLASTQAQQQIEENYANLATQASLAGSKANEQTDPIAYARYKAYSDELNAMAEDLAKNGLTPESRRSMYNMRARYAKDIVPIETAYERRRTLADEQRKMQANANGNLRFDNDFSTMSLDKLLENPDMTYNFLNRDDVVNRTSMLAKQALQSIVDNPEISPAERGLLFTKMRSGATLQQLNEALQRGLQPGETGDAAIDALLQVARTVDTSYQGSSAYDTNWVWNGIAQGLYSGVGTTTYNIMQDPWDISPLQERQIKLQEAQFEWEKEKDTAEFNAKYGNRSGQAVNPDTGNPIFYDDKGIAHEGIPEVVNGIRTGRIYNPVIKKYVNQDGTMSAQGNYAESIGDPVRFKPIFARSWSAGASNAYTRQRTWTGNDEEASKVSYSDIHGRELKKDVKNFLLRVLDVPDLSEEQVKELSGYLDIYRDQDMLSNNHWVIKIPGTDNDGNVLTDSESKRKFNTAMANMSNRVIATPTVTNLVPAGVEGENKK